MQKSSPYYQVFSWTRASLAAGVLIVVLGMLEASNLSIFFGDRDRVGTIDSTTGAITDFPDFGLGGFVNALTFDSNGVLFANVVGTGVGVVNTATGGFSLLASRPPFPAAGCCIESLTAPPPMADLTISKSDSTDPVAAGTNFTYMITASNSGPSDAQNVAVNDTLPTGVTFASTSGCSEDPFANVVAGQPICTLGTIAAGSSAQYTVAVVVASSTFGTVTNTATVTATTPDPDDGNNSIDEDTTVLSPSLVSGAKAVSGDLTSGMVVYTVTLTNSSTADQRDDPASPEFEDVLPQQLNLVEATADSGIATVDIPGKRVIWNGTISAGDTVVITIEAEIVEAFEGQSIVNQGTINFDSDGDGTNDTAAPTDDPATGGGSDPTVFASPKAFGIPTLSEWGIVLLGILLAGMGVRMLKIESQRQ